MTFLNGVQSKISNLIPLKLTETVERHTQTINSVGSAPNTTPPQQKPYRCVILGFIICIRVTSRPKFPPIIAISIP
ncbi:MAG TPA: hypothetical protein DCS60_03320 [Opitutae bacterium]|nr:hypothetical protein [Opitutae bacterium]